jgi:hypothetical protein
MKDRRGPVAEESNARLLTPSYNYAVVQLPGRAYLGVVVQGDTLNALISDLERAASRPELAEEVAFVLERLREARSNYEYVCRERGLDLPYHVADALRVIR